MSVRENLEGWVNHLEEHYALVDSWNETEIKSYVIDPLLNALGWETYNPNIVKREVSVTMGRDTKRADYMLLSLCVVEAKAGASDLDDESCKQAISYAFFLRCPWVIVMNGEKLRLYDCDSFRNNNLNESLVMQLEFLRGNKRNKNELLDSLEYLAKGRFDTEEGQKRLRELKARKNLRKFVEDNKETILNEVIPAWINNKLGQQIDQTFLRNIINEIFGGTQPTAILQPHQPEGNFVITTASDWEYRPKLGRGVFEYKQNPNIRINVDCSTHEVDEQLRQHGLRCSSRQALNGFVYTLREIAGLTRRRGRRR